MNAFFSNLAGKNALRRTFIFTFAILFSLALLFLFPSCKKTQDYFSYLSEYRSNLFLVETEQFSLRIYALEKEHPFVADGGVGELTKRTELYITTKDGSNRCAVTFDLDGKTHGGECSYDSVKREYFYSCAVDTSSLSSIPLCVEIEGSRYEVTAYSVKNTDVLSGREILNRLQEQEGDLFVHLTDKNGFLAEIHLRLLYEETPYYYIGIVEKSGKTTAFLLDAATGKILAKRES